ncbi:MAG: C39 family peptidase [Pirellulaceae bacterium]
MAALTQLRDFAAAEQIIDQMQTINERVDMIHFARAAWLTRQDLYQEAYEETAACEIHPSRSSIGYQAYLLTMLSRDDDAYQLLSDFDEQKQIPSLSWQMAGIAYERRDYLQCTRLLERFESLSPLLERSFGERFAMFRSELARRNGDDATAIEYALQSKSSIGKKFADRLADPNRRDAVDKILPVEFVRQHEMTCGPATLSAISRYWRRPAEHLEVAEEICYNGTTNYAERQWAEQNGYQTREFTLDEASTEALISRDIPFTLVTRGAGFAHLQAVIGYDGRTGSILIRDPSYRVRGAMDMDELLEGQAPHGPRAMLLIPREETHRIEGLTFPDAELYDLLHKMDGALVEHQRDEAMRWLDEMRERAPGHRLVWQACRQMALYDGNDLAILEAVQASLAMYPDDVSLQLSELSLLASVGRTTERVERLRELASGRTAHPLFKLQLAESLVLDGRYRDDAYELLREAIRVGQSYARAYLELAELLWQRYDRQTALRIYRFAACLDDKDEYLAMRYFDASVALGKIDQSLEWLQNRFERFGKQSRLPAVTLYHALTRLRRHDEAIQVLDKALDTRPDDTELVLAVVEALASTSSEYWERAEALLASVRSTAPQRGWHETASYLAVLKGDWHQGLELLQEMLPRTPLSMSLHERIAELVGEIEGEAAVIEHWRKAAEEFPNFQPLVERHAIALRNRPLEEIEPVLRNIIERNPENAWAIRELSQHLLSAGKLEQAEKMIERCAELDGEHSFVALLQASLDSRRGDNASARQRIKKLLAEDISDEFSVAKLMSYCDNVEQTTESLQWVLAELIRQPINGDVLSVYRDYAEPIVPADELLATMKQAVEARRDFWPAHSAYIRQLTQMQLLDEAAAAAESATQQFPLEPETWYEQYRVAVAQGDLDLQRLALERCRLLRPGNAAVIRSLSELLCNEGNYVGARDLLQTLVGSQPFNPVNRGFLGDVLLELGEKNAALDEFKTAVTLDPEYSYGWGRIDELAGELELPDERLKISTQIISEKPHSPASWLQHAQSQMLLERFDDAHQSIDQAEAIDPYLELVHSLRARNFANEGRFEEAIKALQPAIYPTIPPFLDATRAQMLWDIGDHDQAYDLIRRTAEANPAATQFWARLEHWASLRGDHATALARLNTR